MDQQKNSQKKRYSKPMVQSIELTSEETLAVGCKLSGGGSASGGFTCTANSCADPGS